MKLDNISQIALSDLGWNFSIKHFKEFDTTILESSKGYQIFIKNERVVHHNLLDDKKLITTKLYQGQILWLQDDNIIQQTSDQFLSYLNDHSFIGYNSADVKLNKLYFLGRDYLCRLIPKQNLIAIFGMAHNTVGNGKTSHWNTRACLTLWNLRTGSLELEFYPDYQFSIDNIEVSDNEDYLYISQVYEWEDKYIFDLKKRKLIYKDGFTDPNPAETGGSIGCFINDIFLIPPTMCYDGWTGNYRYFDIINNKLNYILPKDEEPKNSISCLQPFEDNLLLIEDGKLKIYQMSELLLGKFNLVDFVFSEQKFHLQNENISSFHFCDNKLYILKDNHFFKVTIQIKDKNMIELNGHWKEGYALEYHTLSSTPIKDENGNITGWDTKRPPIAEELYRLKYWREQYRVDNIARPAAEFLNRYKSKWQLDVIIPIPPSDMTREFQPVYEMAKSIGRLVGLPVDFNTLRKVKSTSQLKEIEDPDTRREILKDAFSINFNALSGKDVLIFDDLYRSGETLNAVCDIIMNKGKARGVYVLTITKTRSKR